ncbi:MAG: hypothetical protein WC766_06235 [Patescibacteria group bacterium]|jgi:hypothetical protein
MTEKEESKDSSSQYEKRELKHTVGAVAKRNKLAELGAKTRNFLTQRTEQLRKPSTRDKIGKFAKRVAGNIQALDKKRSSNTMFSGGFFTGRPSSDSMFSIYSGKRKRGLF